MNISEYRIFSLVAKYRSLTMTADTLCLTKSAVSHALNKMEKELGFPLFIRTNKDVTITEDGERLLPYVNTILNEQRHFEEEVDNMHGLKSGLVRIGTCASVCVNWIPAIVTSFKELYPQIEIQVRSGANNNMMVQWLKENDVDLAIGANSGTGGLKVKHLYDDEMVCVTESGFETENEGYITSDELKGMTLLLQEGAYNEEVSKVLDALDIEASSFMTAFDDSSLYAMAASGLGFCIGGKLAVALAADADICVHSFDPPLYRQLSIMRNAGIQPSPAVRAMSKHIQAFVNNLE